MIVALEGILENREVDSAVIKVGPLSLQVYIPSSTLSHLGNIGDKYLVYLTPLAGFGVYRAIHLDHLNPEPLNTLIKLNYGLNVAIALDKIDAHTIQLQTGIPQPYMIIIPEPSLAIRGKITGLTHRQIRRIKVNNILL